MFRCKRNTAINSGINAIMATIVTTLRQVEILVGQGIARIDAIRDVRITEQTFLPLA